MSKTDAYRFANIIWVEQVIGSGLTIRSFARIMIFSITPWSVGFLISLISGSYLEYLRTPLFYIGSVGIFLTTTGLVFGASQQYGMYDRLVSLYEMDPDQRRNHVVSALTRHSRFWHHMRATAIIFLAGFLSSVSAIYFWDHIGPASSALDTLIPRFRVLESHGWYAESLRHYTFSILIVFLVFISLVLGTSASIMLKLPLFLWGVSGEKPILPPAVIKTHFRPAATFYAVISLLWLAGGAAVFYLFGMNDDWLSYLCVFGTFVVGIVNLSIPQIAYLRTISASEERYIEIVSARFLADIGVKHGAEKDLAITFGAGPQDITTGTVLQLMKCDAWVYPVHQTYVVAGTYIASLIGTAIGWKRVFSFIMQNLG